jgi:hypothetical protein
MPTETLWLSSASLLSKWGFEDGDMPDELCDYFDARGTPWEQVDWHATLVKLVRTFLLPVIDQKIEVDEISTIHNPIRARTVDGQQVDSYETDSSTPLTPDGVDVPLSAILALLVYEDDELEGER